MRPSKRNPDQKRVVTMTRNVSKHAEGSCLIKCGDTHVLCIASLEERIPPWLRGQNRGWVTAEYGMLPRATGDRMRREASAGKQSGRTQEIQRLIGRSLRAVVDLEALGERQITVDCDVLQADGGTRTASITGAWVALNDCIEWMRSRGMISADTKVIKDQVAAISCGIYAGTPVLDLRLSGRFRCGDRFQLCHDRQRRHCRDSGHSRRRTILRRRIRPVDGTGQEGHRWN